MLLLDYQRFGGVLEVIQIERGDRMALISKTGGNLPYLYFLLVYFSMHSYSS